MKKIMFLSMLGIYSFVSAMNQQQNDISKNIVLLSAIKKAVEQIEKNDWANEKKPEGVTKIKVKFSTKDGKVTKRQSTYYFTNTQMNNHKK